MSAVHEPRPRANSAFAAAFLSLIFPGLGHAYAGAPRRALGFAAPPILLGALVGGMALRADRLQLLGFLVQPWVLTAILLLNVIALVYRLIAIVDAYRVASFANALQASGGGRLGIPRVRFSPLGVAGLLAVILVMSGVHVVVARYDLQAMDLVNCIFDSSGTAQCDQGGAPAPGVSPTPSGSPAASASPAATATAAPAASLPPWDGKERLNILLIGTDQRPNEGTYNTDTLIVVSIDPTSRQVAMFTLPRDTAGVPVPPGPAQALWGTTYQGKINSWFMNNSGRADLWPGTNRTRGYTALKAILGNLYGLDIRYYVEVNFDGFRQVVDALGGVTINVQVPVVDDHYPGDNGRDIRVYIPAGVQHMTGAQALIYARSRHGSDDFDRGARQQRVLLSLRQQTDIAAVLPELDQLVSAVKQAVRTDVPIDLLPKLLGLAQEIDTTHIRSFVFAPPLYETVGPNPTVDYVVVPNVDRIRAAVRTAFQVDPAAEALRQKLATEGAKVWVLNGSGLQGQAAQIADFLTSVGIDASAPNQQPDLRGLSATRITAYNGAAGTFAATAAYLKQTFGVQVVAKTDPAVHVDFVITTARTTPDLTPPPQP